MCGTQYSSEQLAQQHTVCNQLQITQGVGLGQWTNIPNSALSYMQVTPTQPSARYFATIEKEANGYSVLNHRDNLRYVFNTMAKLCEFLQKLEIKKD